jgi:protein SCO1/2
MLTRLPNTVHRACALGALLTLAAAGCAAAGDALEGRTWRGVEVTPARPKPDFELTTIDGRPFRFADATRGTLTLLFFGYTSCPDICPVHLANIAAVLRTLPYEDRQRVRVVFVSTDPRRDDPDRIRRWLANFDLSFVGVHGTEEDVHRAEYFTGVAPSAAARPAPGDSAKYEVGHAAQVLAYTADDSLRVMYPFGTRQQDWARDLPRLVKYGANAK